MAILILFSMVVGLMLIGVPIAVSLGLSSMLFLMVVSDASLASVAQTLFSAFEGHFTLLAIPFFILASSFMSTGGVANRIIRFAIAVVGSIRGGLAIASVFACMMFAALSGSSPATVVAIGGIVIAGMVQVGYTREFAAGVICNAGTLGILIPPSIVMVVYASATDVSVGRMFLAGVIPGLLAGLMLMVAIYITARIKNLPAQIQTVKKPLRNIPAKLNPHIINSCIIVPLILLIGYFIAVNCCQLTALATQIGTNAPENKNNRYHQHHDLYNC